jgi:hypothetical protein
MFCVHVKSKEFKEACSRLNIHPSSLETIVFQYLNNVDSESFPSDEYIRSKMKGKAMIDASESQVLLWEKMYSAPRIFKNKENVGNFIKEATRYFSPESLSVYRNNEGQFVVSIAKPRASSQKKANNSAEYMAISSFLEVFDITLNTVNSYDGKLPLFDSLHRVINAKTEKDILKGAGYAVAFMMQNTQEVQNIIALQSFIDGNYDTVVPILGKSLKNLHGIPPMRNRALRKLGDAIEKELKNYVSGRQAEDQNIFQIIKNFLDSIIQNIFYKKQNRVIKATVSDIIEAFAKNDFSLIRGEDTKPGTKEKAEIVDIKKALEENPFESDIIEKLGSKEIALGGGAGLALQGSVYRPSENPLHDLDFALLQDTTRKELEAILKEAFGNTYHTEFFNNIRNSTLSYVVFDRPFTSKKVNNSKINYYDSNNNLIGTLTIGKSVELEVKDGVNGKVLDFFVKNPAKHGAIKKNINGKNYLIMHKDNAWEAKINWSRPKDIWDYNRFAANYDLTVDDSIKEEYENYESELQSILDNAPRNEEGQLLAPNGKPTKLSERQYAQVRTKAFKEWFGDWTKITKNEDGTWNIPADVSKIIDEETGEPKVVYHGSPNTTFTVFDKEKIGSNTDGGFYGRGFYFSEDKGISNKYGKEREFFLNIKNPYEINPDKIGWEESNRRAHIVHNFNAKEPTPYDSELSKYDGVLQTLMENGEVLYMAEIVVPDANQIKSATDNVGTFSTESDDIRFNIQTEEDIYNVLDYFAEVLKDENGISLIHKKYGKYFLTKSAFGGTTSISAADAFDKIQEHLNYALLRHNLPINLLEISKGKASKMVSINEAALKDTISRNDTLASLEGSFKSKEEYKKVKSILEFLANKTGLKYEIISQEKAKELLKSNKIDNVNAFVQGDTCYFIEGRQLNVDIATEEMLHPFVASIRQLNPAAFKSLLRDAQRAFPRLRLEIARDYKGRPIEEIQEELVTQALSRAFREDIKNNPEGHSIKKLIKNFINRIVEIFQSFFGENNSEVITEYKTRVDEILEREEINAQDLQSTITINELAKIVNSELKLHSPNIEDTRMNASWARTSENSYEVSTAGDRRFSAMVAKFNPGTIIEGVDVGGMTIEQVYQSVIKKSRKGQPPAKSSKLYRASVSSYTGNITPEENTIFVFGSNPEGRHGAGAAKIAREQFGAIYGQGEGLQGNSYALPTKDLRVKENRGLRSIPEDTIINSIRKLYEAARQNPDKQFKIAYRNTDSASLNGYTGLEMIDMFIKAGDIPSNIIFSKEWVDTGKFEMSSQELEDYSYKEGYLPLWQEWAKQNPQLIEELRENSAGKTLTDKFANTRVSQARALAEILNSKTEEITETDPKTLEEKLMENNLKLIKEIENLNDLGLSQSEIRHLGEQLMWWISDHITVLQTTPGELERVYGIKETDATKLTRKAIAELVTPDRLMFQCMKAFTGRSGMTPKQAFKIKKIANNWKALIYLSASTFSEIEGFGLIEPGAEFGVMSEIKFTPEDFNNENDVDTIMENEGDIQEHWQVNFRTLDVLDNMTSEVRLELLRCYVLDKQGNPIISEYGIKERINARQAVNTILRICQGRNDLPSMIARLRENRDKYPWLDQIINRLEDSKENDNFKSAFFTTFCKPFVSYSVTRKTKDGKYESIIVNEFPALREAVNSVTTKYKMNQHPMLNTNGVTDDFREIKDIYASLKDAKFEELNLEELKNKLTYVYNVLGYDITPEFIEPLLDDKTVANIVTNLGYIIDNVEQGFFKQGSIYDPFKFRGENNILSSLRNLLKKVTDQLEDTSVASTYDSGKMYQSYVTQSYLSKLMSKFQDENSDAVIEFMQEEYGKYEWFTNSDGTFRTPWLELLSDPKYRKIFKHKVQLNFNKKNYMRNMSKAEYIMSMVTEYFSEMDKDNNFSVAWYRVPMMSNKPSSEFIRFVAYNNVDYQDQISKKMVDIFFQELSRIQTVEMRNSGKENKGYIKNFDSNGKKFCFLDTFNDYLTGKKKRTDEKTGFELGALIRKKLDGKKIPGTDMVLTTSEELALRELAIAEIKESMEARADKILEEWKESGITEKCSSIKGVGTSEEVIEENLRKFIWNDALAAMNIIQLTVTDIAYYKDAEDLQKRFAQIHSPGVRANRHASWGGEKVSDGYVRTIYLNDFEKVVSNVIENVAIVFDNKIKAAKEQAILEGRDPNNDSEVKALEALKESLVGEHGAFRNINVTDAQGYSSATSYRKKAIMFGKWSEASEATYQKLVDGDFTATDLEVAFQPLKPFVYTQIPKPSGVADAPMTNLKVPIQNKNSEYLLVLADAILQNQDTGKPNLLKAINEVMEESAKKNPRAGIDTVQFNSAVKSGLAGSIDITKSKSVEEAKAILEKAIYEGATSTDPYSPIVVDKIPVEDYCIQQEVPAHFRDHEQAHGSQTRAIIVADLLDFYPNGEEVKYKFKDGSVEREVNRKDFIREYEETIAANIEDSISKLMEELHIDTGSDRKSRNLALSRILQREILSNPSRYGTDLLIACSVNEDGEFRIPLGDPIQSKRVEQLINSIIKNRINKQTLPGGPVVQVSNFGTSRQLSIKFKSKDGEVLDTYEEWVNKKENKGKSKADYKEYISENQAGIAYLECFAPAYTRDLFSKFIDEDGNLDVEAIEATDPDLLKMVGYRIPTEDKYSIAPLKIVGFLPREAGDGIMLPYDITLLNGSDFDIDKMYIMFKDLHIRKRKFDKKDSLFFHMQSRVYNSLIAQRQAQGKGYNREATEEKATNIVNTFLSKELSTEKKKEILGDDYRLATKAYRASRYESVHPTSDRARRNNKIIDMTYSIMTHETTADKMLNPGGFDPQKTMGYRVAAYNILSNGITDEAKLLKIWEDLSTKSIDELKELAMTDKNLCFIDTHIQFYDQNNAAGALIGIFAVHKVAHAFLGNDAFTYVSDFAPFTIAGNTISSGMNIDPEKDFSGQYIGKVLGSLVASAADAVKDPILNLMNINSETAITLCTMVRLGIPFDTAAMFLSQKVISDVLKEKATKNIDGYTSLSDIIKKRLSDIENKYHISEDSSINTAELTEKELIIGIKGGDPAIEYKVLSMLASIMNINNDMRGLSYLTRFNSISNAVGPLIIDNLLMEEKLASFPDTIYSQEGVKLSAFDVLRRHPILNKFHETVAMARTLFGEMPTNSENFRDILRNLPDSIRGTILRDRKLLSSLSDFYQSYMLIHSGTIDYKDLPYYINDFPKDYVKILSENPELKSNALIQAIKLAIDDKSGKPILKIDTTGIERDYKESLSSGWADLIKTNKELALQLFKYNFFKGGIVFNPKTFMGLAPNKVKENLDGYVETYRRCPALDPIHFLDLFIRNNWGEYKLVPRLEVTVQASDVKTSKVTFTKAADIEVIGNRRYFKAKLGKTDVLFRVSIATDEEIITDVIQPLGNNKEYLEMSTEEIKTSLSETRQSLEDDSPSTIDATRKETSDGEYDEGGFILIRDTKYNKEEFMEFLVGKDKSQRGLQKVNNASNEEFLSTMAPTLAKICEAKGVKVSVESIAKLFNKYC